MKTPSPRRLNLSQCSLDRLLSQLPLRLTQIWKRPKEAADALQGAKTVQK